MLSEHFFGHLKGGKNFLCHPNKTLPSIIFSLNKFCWNIRTIFIVSSVFQKGRIQAFLADTLAFYEASQNISEQIIERTLLSSRESLFGSLVTITIIFSLNFEFIEEVQVKTGGYGAEYGRSTGGQINVVTKSGGSLSIKDRGSIKGSCFAHWRVFTVVLKRRRRVANA